MATNRRVKFKDNKDFVYVVPFIPIGYIFETTNPDDPSTYYGGTWEQFGKGRVTVAIDTSQTEFNTIGKTGGSKYMQKHKHDVVYGENAVNMGLNSGQYGYKIPYTIGADQTLFTNYQGIGDSGNLQPYIVVYRWRKIAY